VQLVYFRIVSNVFMRRGRRRSNNKLNAGVWWLFIRWKRRSKFIQSGNVGIG